MIKLNKENGQLTIDNYNFSSATTYLELEELKKELQIETRVTNTGSKLYTMVDIDNGDSKIMFMFYKEKLWANVFAGKNYNFPAFTITENEKKVVRQRLDDFGGEKTYNWGSVEFSEDIKGGTISVLIKYN